MVAIEYASSIDWDILLLAVGVWGMSNFRIWILSILQVDGTFDLPDLIKQRVAIQSVQVRTILGRGMKVRSCDACKLQLQD
jgi:hypothetical protein